MSWGKILLGLGLAGSLVWGAAALVRWVGQHDREERASGQAIERAEAMGEAIDRVEHANEAREEIRQPGSTARYDECLRSARNPAVCQRFLPQ